MTLNILHTNGDEFIILHSHSPYKGFYHKTIEGKFYTGKEPGNMLNDELAKYTTHISGVKYIPPFSPQIPTQQDYLKGEFSRYFVRDIQSIDYLETNINTYNDLLSQDDKVDWKNFLVAECNWKLTGDKDEVYEFNKQQIKQIEKQHKFHGLSFYIKEGYLKYFLAT